MSTLFTGPKHWTSVPFSAGSAVALSVDEKEVALLVPNPDPDLAVKTSFGPQREEEVDLCARAHSLLPFTLQVVIPLSSPTRVHPKVNVSPGQVREAVKNCPVTSPKKALYIP